MRKILIFLGVMGLVLVFCGVVTAHPGHNHYPDDFDLKNSSSSQDQSSTSGSGSSARSSSGGGSSSGGSGVINSPNNVNNMPNSQSGLDEVQSVDEDPEASGVNETTVNSNESNEFPWTNLIVFIIIGALIVTGFLYKRRN
ncbi:MAG: hypothetical protein KKF16_04030 [Euryarchaeota archaeon]|nr:hypothetical protein [Euryarchaeota archaeon]MBV1754132.1 hypothetical protein [Methanobacterium sp.]